MGWENSATYGSVIAYNLYWVVIIVGFLALRYKEQRGHWPLMKAKATSSDEKADPSSSDEEGGVGIVEKGDSAGNPFTKVSSVKSGSS